MRSLRAAATGIVALLSAAAALSQPFSRSSPSVAVAGSFIVPADPRTQNGTGGSLDFEAPIAKSLSLGLLVGYWKGGSDFGKDSEVTYLGANGTYRWGAGRLRPFVQLGGGIYRLKLQFTSRNRFAPDDRETRGGGFGGGGCDFMLSRSAALEVRARYHLVADASRVTPDFLETQLGLRFFF